MPLLASVYEIDSTLFQPPDAGKPRGRSASAEKHKASPAQEAETWRARAEETARNYQCLLKSYRQLKERLKEGGEWRRRCSTMLSNTLRNCRDLEQAIEAAEQQAGDNPALAALVSGIASVIDTSLQQLHALGLLEAIEPQPAELFDDNLHEAVDTVVSDEFAAGLIAGLVAIGYACGGRVVRKAKVVLAATGGGPAD